MVQAATARIYNPPILPEFLKRVYDLKPIVGAPNDDEVKGIHAVLRMAHTVAHVPEMFGPELAMSLAQHLFEVQMARYREKYPSGMFPEDMVHTPPTLPSHIPVTLEPVHGVPSDEELQGTQSAIRVYEQMAIARYMHHAPHGELAPKSRSHRRRNGLDGSLGPSTQPQQPVDHADDASDDGPDEIPNETGATDAPMTTGQAATITQAAPMVDENPLQAIAVESNDRLMKIADTLESLKQILIRAQQDHAHGTNMAWHSTGWYTKLAFEPMNKGGELPSGQGLPLLARNGYGKLQASQLSNENLARYLQFYNLGGDLVHSGDTPTIPDDRRDDAEKCLLNYLYRIRPT